MPGEFTALHAGAVERPAPAEAWLTSGMPTLAIVDGVKIRFFAREHPPPHFHAVFAEHRAQIEIASLKVLRGNLPPAKLRAIVSWARTRREPLMKAWDAVHAKRKPEKII